MQDPFIDNIQWAVRAGWHPQFSWRVLYLAGELKTPVRDLVCPYCKAKIVLYVTDRFNCKNLGSWKCMSFRCMGAGSAAELICELAPVVRFNSTSGSLHTTPPQPTEERRPPQPPLDLTTRRLHERLSESVRALTNPYRVPTTVTSHLTRLLQTTATLPRDVPNNN